MPRHDDRNGNTRLYVGRLSSRTRSRDLESLFSKYGRVRDVDMKNDFAFIDFSDSRDADDARYNLDRREINGSRIVVEFAKGAPRGSREYLGKGPPPGSGRCFNCGIDGHWARDCKDGDWKNKCYRCGERGHIERKCTNEPKKTSRGRSDSRSPVRSRSPRHHRGRSPSYSRSRSRSYSRSRSPVKRERSADRQRSSHSPRKRRSEAKSKERKHSPSDNEGNRSPPAAREDGSPDARHRSPLSPGNDSPPARRHLSPAEGKALSPSPRDDRSPASNGNGNSKSPRGSESP